jgi:hypothetical protein
LCTIFCTSQNILLIKYYSPLVASSSFFSGAGASVSFTSTSFLASFQEFLGFDFDFLLFHSSKDFSPSFSSFGKSLGGSCKAFKDKPILFLSGSKLIIFAVTSSPTFMKSLISLTTQ